MGNAADVDTLLWLATIYGLAGQPAAAGRLVDQLLEIDPLTPLHQLLPSLLSLMEGKFSRAMQPFVTHHSAALGNPGTRFMHGQVLAMNGQRDDACEVFDGLHRDAPDTFFAKLGRCYRHALDGDRREMEAAVTEDVRGVAETDPQYSWMLSQCYALTGATDEAITWLETGDRPGLHQLSAVVGLGSAAGQGPERAWIYRVDARRAQTMGGV